jgi:hypothetical protein
MCATLGKDRDGGLWVGTDTEITRVQCGSGYTEFDHELGLPKGFVTDVGRYQGKIYTATQHTSREIPGARRFLSQAA